MDHFFLQGSAGRLYCVYHEASAPSRGRPVLLHLPAFGEEMNKSRRMVALASRGLASRGVATMCLDPFGTGDSEGEFGEAGWLQWMDDASRAIAHLRERGHQRIGLWGLRLGCLLAAEVAREDGAGIQALLLWQPVLSGEQFLNQFLRLRVAGERLRGEGEETVKGLRAGIEAGEAVEITGYSLGRSLCAPLASRSLATLAPSAGTCVQWFEINATGTPPGMAAVKVIDAWQQGGAQVTVEAVAGEPFWSTQEISAAPNLLERTAVTAPGLVCA